MIAIDRVGNAIAIAALLSACTLVACQGSSPAPSPTPAATPTSQVCSALAILPPPLIYPPGGATGIPPTNLAVVLGYAYGSTLTLTAAGAPPLTTAPFVAAPVPLPSSPVTPSPLSTPVAYAVPALQASTTYVVTGSVGLPPCYQPQTFGSFTTR